LAAFSKNVPIYIASFLPSEYIPDLHEPAALFFAVGAASQ